MTEYVLIQKLTAEVRARYQELGQGHYYLRLSKVNEVLTQIEWEHASETIEDHMGFFPSIGSIRTEQY